jgi:hypothetical protein
VEAKKKNMALNWSDITPEGANAKANEFIYVYNHDLSSVEKIERTIRFIIGRLNYYNDHLPSKAQHQIKIDIRGQAVDVQTCESISKRILQYYPAAASISITFIK